MKLLTENKVTASLCALLSAILFAVCIPFSKLLGAHIPSAVMGGLLYLGAGIGLLFTLILKKTKPNLVLTKKEIPYLAAMVILDIAAILCLMFGIAKTTGANASLLGNFELAATSIAAYFLFGEKISKRLIGAIILITFACVILTFEGSGSFVFNIGSVLVLLSCICWGLENNCTRRLSIKDTRLVTIIKGCFSGFGGIVIAFCIGEMLPQVKWIILAMGLGFVSYGVSVSLYIYAQRFLGAAKTGAIFSSAPFLGVIFSVILLGENPLPQFYIAFIIMLAASFLIVRDTHNS